MTALAASSACHRRNTAKRWRNARWRDLVMHTQWRMTPSALSTRTARMRALASYFDGMTVEFPSGITGWMNPTGTINTTTLQAEVDQWNGLDRGNMTQNWAFNLMWYDAPAPLVWTDSYWSQIVDNAAAYASVMKDAEDIHGIFFDSEYYNQAGQTPYWGQWPEGAPGGQALQASIDKTRERGHALMDALKSEWPDVNVCQVFGPGHSYVGTPPFLGVNDVVSHNDLHGALGAGMQESCQDAGSRCMWIDGNEFYLIRSGTEGFKVTWWSEVGVPQRVPVNGSNGTVDLVDPVMAAGYRTPSGQSAFDRVTESGFAEASNTQLTNWIEWGMRSTRSICWFYSELHDFWEGLHTWAPAGRDVPSTATMDAIAEGRRRGRL